MVYSRGQDPKKASNEKQFRINLYGNLRKIICLQSGGQEELDYMSLLAMMFGIMGLFMKPLCVGTYYLIIILNDSIMSVVNMKTSELDFRQVMSSFSISLMGLVMAYFGPQSHMFI